MASRRAHDARSGSGSATSDMVGLLALRQLRELSMAGHAMRPLIVYRGRLASASSAALHRPANGRVRNCRASLLAFACERTRV